MAARQTLNLTHAPNRAIRNKMDVFNDKLQSRKFQCKHH